jgi:hypothetical protein
MYKIVLSESTVHVPTFDTRFFTHLRGASTPVHKNGRLGQTWAPNASSLDVHLLLQMTRSKHGQLACLDRQRCGNHTPPPHKNHRQHMAHESMSGQKQSGPVKNMNRGQTYRPVHPQNLCSCSLRGAETRVRCPIVDRTTRPIEYQPGRKRKGTVVPPRQWQAFVAKLRLRVGVSRGHVATWRLCEGLLGHAKSTLA